MTDAAPAPQPGQPPKADSRRPRFSIVWLIPIMASILAGYLGYQTVSQRGPLLQITFETADGISAGQTQLKDRNVTLGTVESVDLAPDGRHVIVGVRMNQVGAKFLTSHARFWVVRPNFNGGSVSGLDTLVSGAYITLDPGAPGGHRQRKFIGLEEAPGVTSDQPGTTFVLKADRIGALSSNSPVFFRDVEVGQVLGYDIGDGRGPVTISVFVKAPFDKLVEPQSHFWNSSGISASIKNGALQIEFQSLQAIVSGGVTFDSPVVAGSGPSPGNATFPLYPSEDAANAAGYSRKIEMVSYFETPVGGLADGAPVNVLGIQVGEVTQVTLLVDPMKGTAAVRVKFVLQPERVFKTKLLQGDVTPDEGMQNLLNHGLRVGMDTVNYVTGQQALSLSFVPGSKVTAVTKQGDAYVVPSRPGQFDAAIASLTVISTKLAKIPFDQIGDNVNKLLITANRQLGSADIKQTLASLSATLNATTLTLQSVNQSYGADSDFQRNLEQLMGQANDTLRTIDLLTAYLDRNPQALLLGRSRQ